ncbi:MAG: protein-glutamate O-methyltransferase CheR [Magnetococcales bacterium]|nr:protein-glutamate O-methyltransferase CheR [Magnetococcales bacterium]MBF0114178.1 protein-glutamate O-methyltransferase CheR [Magnetococcales bacterium]
MKVSELEEVEITLFLETLRLRHGYDFRHYSRASLRRRLLSLQRMFAVEHLVELLPRLLREETILSKVLATLSVPVTEMFRDPEVFLLLRRHVLPVLRTFPRINIWQVGSATGEEAYSLAILMAEEGCLPQCQIYATDINDAALATAEAGIFPARRMALYSENYRLAGGAGKLSDYCQTHLDVVEMHEPLRRAMVFAHHNLVADGVFCEAHLVMCRNVLIYFDRFLQGRCLGLMRASLVRGGFLCLGLQETLDAYGEKEDFQAVDRLLRVFRLRTEGGLR